MKVRLNNDKEMVDFVRKGLEVREGYCPCRVDKIDDYKCMCKEFREQKEAGFCHCGLYEKYEG